MKNKFKIPSKADLKEIFLEVLNLNYSVITVKQLSDAAGQGPSLVEKICSHNTNRANSRYPSMYLMLVMYWVIQSNPDAQMTQRLSTLIDEVQGNCKKVASGDYKTTIIQHFIVKGEMMTVTEIAKLSGKKRSAVGSKIKYYERQDGDDVTDLFFLNDG